MAPRPEDDVLKESVTNPVETSVNQEKMSSWNNFTAQVSLHKKEETMPFTKHKLTVDDLSFRFVENIGACLGRYCTAHFASVWDARADVGLMSCNAAVAIEPHGSYDRLAPTFPASVVYGNSQVFKGLDPDFNASLYDTTHGQFSNSDRQEHAEQVAYRVAENKRFFRDGNRECHLFVELSPCPKCVDWLNQRPETWKVWYLYDYGMTQKELAAAKRQQLNAITGGIRGKKRTAALAGIQSDASPQKRTCLR
jgi:hypothetical protein